MRVVVALVSRCAREQEAHEQTSMLTWRRQARRTAHRRRRLQRRADIATPACPLQSGLATRNCHFSAATGHQWAGKAGLCASVAYGRGDSLPRAYVRLLPVRMR